MNVSVSEITNAVLMLLDENRALLETRLTYCDPGTDLISLARRLLPEAARLESARPHPAISAKVFRLKRLSGTMPTAWPRRNFPTIFRGCCTCA